MSCSTNLSDWDVLKTPCQSSGCNYPESGCDGTCAKQLPRHFKPQTTQQRLKVTRRIGEIEQDMSVDLAKPPLRYFTSPKRLPIEYAEPEPEAFYLFDPWPLGVRLCLIAFLMIVASVVIAVFYLN